MNSFKIKQFFLAVTKVCLYIKIYNHIHFFCLMKMAPPPQENFEKEILLLSYQTHLKIFLTAKYYFDD